MTVEVASREIASSADPGARGSRGAGEAAAAPREPVPREAAASQAALDALLYELLPRQGCWCDEGYYLWLTDHGNRPVEFTDGFIEELPLPTSTQSCRPLVSLRPVPRLDPAARRHRGITPEP